MKGWAELRDTTTRSLFYARMISDDSQGNGLKGNNPQSNGKGARRGESGEYRPPTLEEMTSVTKRGGAQDCSRWFRWNKPAAFCAAEKEAAKASNA